MEKKSYGRIFPRSVVAFYKGTDTDSLRIPISKHEIGVF